MLSLVLAGRSGARIRLFDYGVHRCAALACFTPTDAACAAARTAIGIPSVLQDPS